MEFVIQKGRKYKKEKRVVVATENIKLTDSSRDRFEGVIIEDDDKKLVGKLVSNNDIHKFKDFCAERINQGAIYQGINAENVYILATSNAYYDRQEGKEVVVFNGVSLNGADSGKAYNGLFVDSFEPADVHIKLVKN